MRAHTSRTNGRSRVPKPPTRMRAVHLGISTASGVCVRPSTCGEALTFHIDRILAPRARRTEALCFSYSGPPWSLKQAPSLGPDSRWGSKVLGKPTGTKVRTYVQYVRTYVLPCCTCNYEYSVQGRTSPLRPGGTRRLRYVRTRTYEVLRTCTVQYISLASSD